MHLTSSACRVLSAAEKTPSHHAGMSYPVRVQPISLVVFCLLVYGWFERHKIKDNIYRTSKVYFWWEENPAGWGQGGDKIERRALPSRQAPVASRWRERRPVVAGSPSVVAEALARCCGEAASVIAEVLSHWAFAVIRFYCNYRWSSCHAIN